MAESQETDIIFPKRRFRRGPPLDPCLGVYRQPSNAVMGSPIQALFIDQVSAAFGPSRASVQPRTTKSDPTPLPTNQGRTLVRARSLQPPSFPRTRGLLSAIIGHAGSTPPGPASSSPKMEFTEIPPQVTVEAFLQDNSIPNKPRNTRTYAGRRRARTKSRNFVDMNAGYRADDVPDDSADSDSVTGRARKKKLFSGTKAFKPKAAGRKNFRPSLGHRLALAGAHIPQRLGPNGTPPLDFGHLPDPIRHPEGSRLDQNSKKWRPIDPNAPIAFPTPFFASRPIPEPVVIAPITAHQPWNSSNNGTRDSERDLDRLEFTRIAPAQPSSGTAQLPSNRSDQAAETKTQHVGVYHTIELSFVPMGEHEEQLRKRRKLNTSSRPKFSSSESNLAPAIHFIDDSRQERPGRPAAVDDQAPSMGNRAVNPTTALPPPSPHASGVSGVEGPAVPETSYVCPVGPTNCAKISLPTWTTLPDNYSDPSQSLGSPRTAP